MDELKPCHFCGGEAVILELYDHSFCVMCGCGAEIEAIDREYAVKAWNRRVSDGK